MIAVEHSYTGQVAKVITMKAGIEIEKNISKYTDRPIYKDELKDAIESSLDGSKKEVLSHGP